MTQSQALSILKTGANVFLTGEPGSGKTHTVNEYAGYLRAHGIEPAITASTGIAATHIGGMTIHSWSGIGIKTALHEKDVREIAGHAHIVKRIGRARVLIIDEVSMLSSGTLSMVDAVCRAVKKNTKPFGGLQAVFVGDFFQLPPVMKREDNPGAGQSALLPETAGLFACDSSAWQEANPTACYLTEQYRQDDGHFLSLLSAIRRRAFGADHLRHIEARKTAQSEAPAGAPKLFAHNADVDRINGEMLATLKGEPREFAMRAHGPDALVFSLKKGCLSPEILSLKIGAAVMCTKNNPKERFVNGTLGMVEAFDELTGNPFIRARNGRRILVEPMEWSMEENGVPRARITQLPLRLAWAITVHKSQGMSLDEAVMDLSRVFEFGQGYVALSRVRRLSGLYMLGWNARAFEVHPEVCARDEVFRFSSASAEKTSAAMPLVLRVKTEERFIAACGGKRRALREASACAGGRASAR